MRQIAALYEVETEIRGQPAEDRRRVRQQRSRPLIATMQAWLADTLGRISGRSALAEVADSGDREQSVHSIMNTDSGDHEHLFAPD